MLHVPPSTTRNSVLMHCRCFCDWWDGVCVWGGGSVSIILTSLLLSSLHVTPVSPHFPAPLFSFSPTACIPPSLYTAEMREYRRGGGEGGNMAASVSCGAHPTVPAWAVRQNALVLNHRQCFPSRGGGSGEKGAPSFRKHNQPSSASGLPASVPRRRRAGGAVSQSRVLIGRNHGD